MGLKYGDLVHHITYGICYYQGETSHGEAIIEVHRDGKFLDRLPVKSEELVSVSYTVANKLKEKLGDRYKEWHTKEVSGLVSRGYDIEKSVHSFIKKLNKKL